MERHKKIAAQQIAHISVLLIVIILGSIQPATAQVDFPIGYVSRGGTRPDSGFKAGNAWFEFTALSNELVTPRILACPADDAAARVKALVGATATSDLNVARTLAYGGYSYVLLGEGWCESPVKLRSVPDSTGSGTAGSRNKVTRPVEVS